MKPINLNSFLSESLAEIKQITWPTRKETVRLVIIVTAFSIIMSVFLGAADYGFMAMLQKYVLKF